MEKEAKLAVFHAERINGWPGRNAPLVAFQSSAESLKRKGFRIVEVGGSASLPGIAEYRKTSFPELCSLISSAAIFVGHDSAPFHVAQAFGVPAVVPFGAIRPELRDYSGKVFPVVVPMIDCLGCHHVQEAPRTTQSCPRGIPICMTGITGALFEPAIKRALQEGK
jgi:ADP-heptose:LPS heptosyltransferase